MIPVIVAGAGAFLGYLAVHSLYKSIGNQGPAGSIEPVSFSAGILPEYFGGAEQGWSPAGLYYGPIGDAHSPAFDAAELALLAQEAQAAADAAQREQQSQNNPSGGGGGAGGGSGSGGGSAGGAGK